MYPLSAAEPASIDQTSRLKAFGIKMTPGGAHSSRTMMLDEITRLLTAVSLNAKEEVYMNTVLNDNLLGKKTVATREKTFRYLRELYGLSMAIPIFQTYRQLCEFDSSSFPLLSLLVSLARDPQLRASTEVVMEAKVGEEVPGDKFQQAISMAFDRRYSANNIGKISRNTASSWTQSGHLTGHLKKIRKRVQPRPASLTLSLILSQLGGWHGERIFSTWWCRILDLTASEARTLAIEANRQGLLSLKGIGDVIEISFPRFRLSAG
jgi:hypothetical protein